MGAGCAKNVDVAPSRPLQRSSSYEDFSDLQVDERESKFATVAVRFPEMQHGMPHAIPSFSTKSDAESTLVQSDAMTDGEESASSKKTSVTAYTQAESVGSEQSSVMVAGHKTIFVDNVPVEMHESELNIILASVAGPVVAKSVVKAEDGTVKRFLIKFRRSKQCADFTTAFNRVAGVAALVDYSHDGDIELRQAAPVPPETRSPHTSQSQSHPLLMFLNEEKDQPALVVHLNLATLSITSSASSDTFSSHGPETFEGMDEVEPGDDFLALGDLGSPAPPEPEPLPPQYTITHGDVFVYNAAISVEALAGLLSQYGTVQFCLAVNVLGGGFAVRMEDVALHPIIAGQLNGAVLSTGQSINCGIVNVSSN